MVAVVLHRYTQKSRFDKQFQHASTTTIHQSFQLLQVHAMSKKPTNPNHLSDGLRAAAASLRSRQMGADESHAAMLESLAGAVEEPIGYTLKVLGAIDRTVFEKTAESAKHAAIDMAYSEREFEVVPLLCVPSK